MAAAAKAAAAAVAKAAADNNKLKVPQWKQHQTVASYIRVLNAWKMGTTCRDTKMAATVVFEGFQGQMYEDGVEWLNLFPAEAIQPDGLDILMEYMRQRLEGERRDVRLGYVNQMFKVSRPEGMAIQTYLNKVEQHLGRLKEVGFDMNPPVSDAVREYIEILPVVGGPDTIDLHGVTTAAQVKARLDYTDKLERAMQEILFSLIFNSSRLSHHDRKSILSKYSTEILTYPKLAKELRYIYPLQPEETSLGSSKRKGQVFLSDRAAGSSEMPTYHYEGEDEFNYLHNPEIMYETVDEEDEADGDYEYYCEECDDQDYPPDILDDDTLEVSEQVCNLLAKSDPQAFLTKYKVTFDQKKKVYRVKPKASGKNKAKGGKKGKGGKGGNPWKDGKQLLCSNCGSKDHFAYACPHPKKKTAWKAQPKMKPFPKTKQHPKRKALFTSAGDEQDW